MSLQSKLSLLKFSALMKRGQAIAEGLERKNLSSWMVDMMASAALLTGAVLMGFAAFGCAIGASLWALPLALGAWCCAGIGYGVFDASKSAQVRLPQVEDPALQPSANEDGLGKKTAAPGFNNTVKNEQSAPAEKPGIMPPPGCC